MFLTKFEKSPCYVVMSFINFFFIFKILILGQALCPSCRENTHRAKMFSTHEVIPMSKCAKDGHRRVNHYI